MAQRIVNGEQYEATLIGGNIDGSPVDVEGSIQVANLQGTSSFAVTPNNSSNLSPTANALYVGYTGNLTILGLQDTSPVTFFNVAGGTFFPLQVKKVYASGTTASGIVGIV